MSYFKHHVFFCTNQRGDDSPCCQDFGADKARAYLKQRCKDEKCHGPGQVRINTAGCLDRCQHGPVLVIYPGETWYTYIDEEDLNEIFELHIKRGEVVERLLVPRSD